MSINDPTHTDTGWSDLSRTGTAGPVTDADVLLVQHLTNPDAGRLEQAIRADERRKVAEEIGKALDAKAWRLEALSNEIEGAEDAANAYADAAKLAREYGEPEQEPCAICSSVGAGCPECREDGR